MQQRKLVGTYQYVDAPYYLYIDIYIYLYIHGNGGYVYIICITYNIMIIQIDAIKCNPEVKFLRKIWRC